MDKEFPPFRLDTTNQCLWRRRDSGDEERILLRPKSYAVLRYLVERAGRLVTEDELLEAVWPDVYVQPQAVKSHLFDVRRVSGRRVRRSRCSSRLFPNAGTGSLLRSVTVHCRRESAVRSNAEHAGWPTEAT